MQRNGALILLEELLSVTVDGSGDEVDSDYYDGEYEAAGKLFI